jgi:hypothetical protein
MTGDRPNIQRILTFPCCGNPPVTAISALTAPAIRRSWVRSGVRRMGALHKNHIAGEWVDGAAVSRNINPSDTKDVVGEYAQAHHGQPKNPPSPTRVAKSGGKSSPRPSRSLTTHHSAPLAG